MKVHSVLFNDFVDIFLKEELESAIAASRNAQRRDDLGLVQHAAMAALKQGRYAPEKPRIVEDRSAGKARRIAVWPLRERMVMRAPTGRRPGASIAASCPAASAASKAAPVMTP